MSTYKNGEYIPLCWEYRPDEFYVRGHMPSDVAREIIEYETGDYIFSDPVPAYGRWGIRTGEDGWCRTFYDYGTPGRGRFPIMKATCIRDKTEEEMKEMRQ